MNNCGACDNVCGEEAPLCCGGQCINPQSNLEHCGVCQSPCSDGSDCCRGECYSVTVYRTSPFDCGACGNACAEGQQCCDGRCEPDDRPCCAAERRCGEACCQSHEVCIDGSCLAVCFEGEVSCEIQRADGSLDWNCCEEGSSCYRGACCGLPTSPFICRSVDRPGEDVCCGYGEVCCTPGLFDIWGPHCCDVGTYCCTDICCPEGQRCTVASTEAGSSYGTCG